METVSCLLRKLFIPSKYHYRHNYKGLWVTRGKYKYKGLVPGLAKTLEERLNDENVKEFSPNYIGLSMKNYSKKCSRLERIKEMKTMHENYEIKKKSKEHKLTVPLKEVHEDWLNESGPQQLCRVIHHYGIFKDLFDEVSYFLPLVPVRVCFDYSDDLVSVVHHGNYIKPREALNPPTIAFEADEKTLWSIMLINLDGHLIEQDKEYLHFFIGNIPGNCVEKGETIVPYLPPIPVKGTGYHRYVILLYLQNKIVDFTPYKIPSDNQLSHRTFCNADFYHQHEGELTPAGLSFFQSDYDLSVKNTFHKILNIEEPVYRYDFPKPYTKPQEWIPENRSFNNYLDLHTDPKKIQERVLLKKLKKFDPFNGFEKPLEYPLAHRELWWEDKPNWLRVELSRELTRKQKYQDDE